MDKVKDIEERKWYISQTIKNGWSTNVLKNQIKNKLYISYYKIYLNICKVNYQKQKKQKECKIMKNNTLNFLDTVEKIWQPQVAKV